MGEDDEMSPRHASMKEVSSRLFDATRGVVSGEYPRDTSLEDLEHDAKDNERALPRLAKSEGVKTKDGRGRKVQHDVAT